MEHITRLRASLETAYEERLRLTTAHRKVWSSPTSDIHTIEDKMHLVNDRIDELQAKLHEAEMGCRPDLPADQLEVFKALKVGDKVAHAGTGLYSTVEMVGDSIVWCEGEDETHIAYVLIFNTIYILPRAWPGVEPTAAEVRWAEHVFNLQTGDWS